MPDKVYTLSQVIAALRQVRDDYEEMYADGVIGDAERITARVAISEAANYLTINEDLISMDSPVPLRKGGKYEN